MHMNRLEKEAIKAIFVVMSLPIVVSVLLALIYDNWRLIAPIWLLSQIAWGYFVARSN